MSTNSDYAKGHVIDDRFEIIEVLGRGVIGTAYHAVDRQKIGAANENVVLKDLPLKCDDDCFQNLDEIIRPLLKLKNRSVVDIYELFRKDEKIFLVMEFVDGELLSHHLSMRRSNGQILGLKAAYSLIAHILSALESIHALRLAHGSLSPESVVVTKQGRIKITNTSYSHIANRYLDDVLRDVYFKSKFVAPEVVTDRNAVSPSADIYSCALLCAELLSPFPFADFSGSPEAYIDSLDIANDAVKTLFKKNVNASPEKRSRSVTDFRDELKHLIDAPNDSDLPSIVMSVNTLKDISASLPPARNRDNDLFSKKSLTTRKPGNEIWIVQKDNLDYGPFSKQGVLDMLYRDEIYERTPTLNMSTQQRDYLINIPEFAEEVKAYIPKREARLEELQAEKDRKIKKIKKASSFSVTAIVIAAVVFAGMSVMAYLALPDPTPIDLSAGFTPFPHRFQAPKVEEISLNVNTDKAKAIFDPKASAEEREAALRAWEAEQAKKFAGKRRHRGSRVPGEDGFDEVYTIDFGLEDGKEVPPLADWEIEEQLYSSRMLRKEADCIIKHSGGRRTNVSVDFIIAQSGQVRSVRTSASGELDTCIKNAIASMRFRHFGGTIKKVTDHRINYQ